MDFSYVDDKKFCQDVRKVIEEFTAKPEELTFYRNYILLLVDKALSEYQDKSDLFNTYQAEFICGMIMGIGEELGDALFSELIEMIAERDYELAYKNDNDFIKSEFACTCDDDNSIDITKSEEPELDRVPIPQPPPNSPDPSST